MSSHGIINRYLNSSTVNLSRYDPIFDVTSMYSMVHPSLLSSQQLPGLGPYFREVWKLQISTFIIKSHKGICLELWEQNQLQYLKDYSVCHILSTAYHQMCMIFSQAVSASALQIWEEASLPVNNFGRRFLWKRKERQMSYYSFLKHMIYDLLAFLPSGRLTNRIIHVLVVYISCCYCYLKVGNNYLPDSIHFKNCCKSYIFYYLQNEWNLGRMFLAKRIFVWMFIRYWGVWSWSQFAANVFGRECSFLILWVGG